MLKLSKNSKFCFENISKFLIIIIFACFFSSCGIYKKTDSNVPQNALERAKKNVEEGRGVSAKGLFSRNGTNFEFSSSNPLWRASLETLDFMPLTNVDYSGGVISTDWYSDTNSKDSIKITIRFLSNEVSSNSLKIIVHQKVCADNLRCSVKTLKSKLEDQLRKEILGKAAMLQKNQKSK